jgi:hypothetical protein
LESKGRVLTPARCNRITDAAEIREAVENWVVWRDTGDWERFATVWHSAAVMSATWFYGSAVDIIAASRAGFERGVLILHTLGGFACEIVRTRAIAQTKMTIMQRADVDGVLVDVSCTGRFYDFFEKRRGIWKIARRQPIYEKDRLDPIDPAASIRLDRELLSRFPDGDRHLAYVQSKNGFTVRTGLPGLRGPDVEQLYAEGRTWLGR